jgi:hypothetical protein
MAIPDYARTNFDTLLRAASEGNLAHMECLDTATREPRYVICAVGRSDASTSSRHLAISATAIPTTPTCHPILTIRLASS